MNNGDLAERKTLDAAGAMASPKAAAKFKLLAGQPIFAALTIEDIKLLTERARFEHRRKGETLFHRGDVGHTLMVLVSGGVKCWIEGTEGRSVTLSVVRPGQMFGEIAILDGEPRTANVTCVADSELLVVDRRDIQPLLARQSDLSKNFMRILCERIRWWANLELENVSLLASDKRIARTVCQLLEQSDAIDNKLVITQREIGEMVGLSRESTNKVLRSWALKNWISIGKGWIKIHHKDRLERIVETD